MNVVFSVTFTGTPDADDTRAAYQIVFNENQRRGALAPPGTPLPIDTPTNLKASYLGLMTASVAAEHQQNILLAKTQAITTRLTDPQMQAFFSSIMDQLNAGATVASLLAKLAA